MNVFVIAGVRVSVTPDAGAIFYFDEGLLYFANMKTMIYVATSYHTNENERKTVTERISMSMNTGKSTSVTVGVDVIVNLSESQKVVSNRYSV